MVYDYVCDACDFRVRSEDDEELLEIVRHHADAKHDTKLSREDVRNGWEESNV